MSLITLPYDLRWLLLTYLPPQDLFALLQTCTSFSCFLHNELLWQEKCHRDFAYDNSSIRLTTTHTYRLSYSLMFEMSEFFRQGRRCYEQVLSEMTKYLAQEITEYRYSSILGDKALYEEGEFTFRLYFIYPLPPYCLVRQGDVHYLEPDIFVTGGLHRYSDQTLLYYISIGESKLRHSLTHEALAMDSVLLHFAEGNDFEDKKILRFLFPSPQLFPVVLDRIREAGYVPVSQIQQVFPAADQLLSRYPSYFDHKVRVMTK